MKKGAASIGRGFATDQRPELIFVSHLIRIRKRTRKTSLAGLSPHLTASKADVAFLNAQITDHEQQCAAMHGRINHKGPERTPRGAPRMSFPQH
jgi:hypothetical protein